MEVVDGRAPSGSEAPDELELLQPALHASTGALRTRSGTVGLGWRLHGLGWRLHAGSLRRLRHGASSVLSLEGEAGEVHLVSYRERRPRSRKAKVEAMSTSRQMEAMATGRTSTAARGSPDAARRAAANCSAAHRLANFSAKTALQLPLSLPAIAAVTWKLCHDDLLMSLLIALLSVEGWRAAARRVGPRHALDVHRRRRRAASGPAHPGQRT